MRGHRVVDDQLRCPIRHRQAAKALDQEHNSIAALLNFVNQRLVGEPGSRGDREALRNLVLNAMDAMPKGGELAIRTRAVDGRVTIEVTDSGEGLTKEECERLFTPYYTTKRHGTGLGLASMRQRALKGCPTLILSTHGCGWRSGCRCELRLMKCRPVFLWSREQRQR